MPAQTKRKTTVGDIDQEVLLFTAGQDVHTDLALVEADCIGTAGHVTMLAKMPITPHLISSAECKNIIHELVAILAKAAKGKFKITLEDQDVHLAVERTLTSKLGNLGKRVHTGRSRNDQVATDLRLFAKDQLLKLFAEASALADALLRFATKHQGEPMVGRTHMQPAMPSSVGLWATAHLESLLDDVFVTMNAYALNNKCPLGSAASYGVPLPINRQLVSDLLGFTRPIHNVLYANNARGKMESVSMSALGQIMTSLSRLAQDLILFTMPEFNYFALPDAFCTGSSIMPQKKNPDVLELVRAKTARVQANALAVQQIITSAPSGYNRDLQETKQPFIESFGIVRSTLRIMNQLVRELKVKQQSLLKAFTADVFATDYALELVRKGMPFRDAYQHVKTHIDELQNQDPYDAIARKKHLGATSGLDFDAYTDRIEEVSAFASDETRRFHDTISALLGVRYPVK